jgi:hypothetical protein
VRYDLDAAETRRRCAEFLAGHPGPGRFVSVVAGPDEPLADVGRTVEREVFEESFGNDAAVMAGEYAAYECRSLFFVVLDRRRGMPAGAGRIIEDDRGARVKTIDDAPAHIGKDIGEIVAAHGLTGAKVWDFATAAVLPAYRGGRSGLAVSSLIYRSFLLAGSRAGALHVVVMLDRRAYRNMRLLGAELTALAGSGPFEYLGSAENHALYVRFDELAPSIAAQAARLRRPFAPIRGEIRARGPRRLLTRRIAARVAHRVSSGTGLDPHITFIPQALARHPGRAPVAGATGPRQREWGG